MNTRMATYDGTLRKLEVVNAWMFHARPGFLLPGGIRLEAATWVVIVWVSDRWSRSASGWATIPVPEDRRVLEFAYDAALEDALVVARG